MPVGSAGLELIYLPPYSPDWNLVEEVCFLAYCGYYAPVHQL